MIAEFGRRLGSKDKVARKRKPLLANPIVKAGIVGGAGLATLGLIALKGKKISKGIDETVGQIGNQAKKAADALEDHVKREEIKTKEFIDLTTDAINKKKASVAASKGMSVEELDSMMMGDRLNKMVHKKGGKYKTLKRKSSRNYLRKRSNFMFLCDVVEFARTQGAKDKKKRLHKAAVIAGTALAGGGAGYLALKNKAVQKAITENIIKPLKSRQTGIIKNRTNMNIDEPIQKVRARITMNSPLKEIRKGYNDLKGRYGTDLRKKYNTSNKRVKRAVQTSIVANSIGLGVGAGAITNKYLDRKDA